MPDEPRHDDLGLDVREVPTDTVPGPVGEGLEGLPHVVLELGVLVQPALRNELVRAHEVHGAVRNRGDRDADDDAFGKELPVDDGPTGRDNTMVGLGRRGVYTNGFFDACEQILALVDAYEGDFFRTLEISSDLLG